MKPSKPTGTGKTIIEAASRLRSQGYGFVWLQTGQKMPKRREWTLRSDEPDDYKVGSNLGLMTGKISGNLVCVDLDSVEALDAADDFLPPTDMVDGRPGKPRSHRWFIVTDVPPEMTSTAGGGIGGPWLKHFPGIDFLGTGGQAVVPPSRHSSGEQRIWYADGKPAVVPMVELWAAVTRLAEFCGWEPPTPPPTDGLCNGHHAEGAPAIERAKKYLAKIPGAVSGQLGHNRAFHTACVLTHGFALSAADAYPLLFDWNAKCDPPWSEKELRHKLEDAAKKEGPRGHLLNTVSPARAGRNGEPSSNGHHATPDDQTQ